MIPNLKTGGRVGMLFLILVKLVFDAFLWEGVVKDLLKKEGKL